MIKHDYTTCGLPFSLFMALATTVLALVGVTLIFRSPSVGTVIVEVTNVLVAVCFWWRVFDILGKRKRGVR